MKIGLAGFLHESHSWAPYPADMVAFETPGGFPGLCRGAAVMDALDGTRMPAAGAIDVFRKAGHEIVPLAYGIAMPSAPVTREAFDTITGWIIEDAAAAGLDALYLDLHGAMMAEHEPDGEGAFLARLRARLGPDLPIAAPLDLHANVTPAMVALSDVLASYRTYPHIDMPETGARAAELLLRRIAFGRPFAKALRQIDFLIPISAMCTMMQPMGPIYDQIEPIMQRTGALELSLNLGFPYCDFPDCGPAITAHAETQEAADAAADSLLAVFLAQRSVMGRPNLTPAEAVAHLSAHARPSGPPIVLADTQDNPGGGGHGDTMGLLSALVAGGIAGAVIGVINDAASAAAAHQAGVGATIDLALGGISDGAPLRAGFKVLALSDGKFVCTGPMTRGNRADLGPTALIETGGVRVVVASHKMQAYDQAMFRVVGIDPATLPAIALKSSVHFRADFQPIAAEVLVVDAPGPVISDPSGLPFTKLRPSLALRP